MPAALLAVLTFKGLVEYGRATGAALHGENKMPWSFKLFGAPVTHENDQMYIISLPMQNLHVTYADLIEVWSDGTIELKDSITIGSV